MKDWIVIESKFRWTTYREIWFRGTREECISALSYLAKSEPDRMFDAVEC
jgi:hypothetical protein